MTQHLYIVTEEDVPERTVEYYEERRRLRQQAEAEAAREAAEAEAEEARREALVSTPIPFDSSLRRKPREGDSDPT